MSKTDSLHYNLCCLGAKWLTRKDYFDFYKCCNYAVVELVCAAAESPDIFGFSGDHSTMIEVKTSRSDFLRDKDKFSRNNLDYALGNYRFYLCPCNVIKVEDLPLKWGLLWYDGKDISVIKEAEYQKVNNRSELAVMCSIMRREGIKNQVFNYRK